MDVEFPERVQVFIGPNGSGKSNILEAIFILGQGKSFRFSQVADWISQGNSECLVKAQIRIKDLSSELRLLAQTTGKAFYCQGKKIPSKKLQDIFPLILFSPESLEAIKGSAEQRRNLLDDVVCTSIPKGSAQLEAFSRLLKTRNRLLRNICQNPEDKNSLDVLMSLQDLYLVQAAEVVALRLRIIRQLELYLQENIRRLTRQNQRPVGFDYLISGQKLEAPLEQVASQAHHWMKNRWQTLHSTELSTGSSLIGPHKHDVRIQMDGRDSRIFCSQGQQRTLILAFKMAHIVYHGKTHEVDPLLLLDDVLSELDEATQKSFLEFLQEQSSQVILTSTEMPECISHHSLKVTDLTTWTSKSEQGLWV